MSNFRPQGNVVIPPSSTWANRGSGAYTGERKLITDAGVSTSEFWWNGTRWRPASGRMVLHEIAAPVTTTADTNEQIADYVAIPIGLVINGDILKTRFACTKSSTSDTATIRHRLGTAHTTSDTSMGVATASLATTQRSQNFTVELKRISATSFMPLSLTSSTNGIGISTSLNSAITITDMDANQIYLDLSSQMTSGSETITFNSWLVELICGA
jgi:hypothetical protein